MQLKGEQQKLSLDHQLSLAKITEENGPRRDASHRLDAVDFSTELEPVRWTHGVIAKTPALAMIAAPNPRNLDRSWNAAWNPASTSNARPYGSNHPSALIAIGRRRLVGLVFPHASTWLL